MFSNARAIRFNQNARQRLHDFVPPPCWQNADYQQVVASDNPSQKPSYNNSAASSCSFSAFNPFGEFEGKTIDRTEYFGGGSRFYFTDGTSGFVDIVVPTDKISVKEMIAYQAKGILVLSGGMK